MIQKILIVNKDREYMNWLVQLLNSEDFTVSCADDGKEALEKIGELPDMVILDTSLRKMNGLEVLHEIRHNEQYKHIPVIFIASQDSEAAEIAALEIGANDFLTKQISASKLIARIKSNLKKASDLQELYNDLQHRVKIGPLEIDKIKHEVLIEGNLISLPRKEFDVLFYLASQSEKVINRDKILKEIWGSNSLVKKRTVDVHIRKIRMKMGSHFDLIQTIKGSGYKIKST
ncbi:MAG: response regulator transcription factor [Bacteroidota bacterium]|nr:response regulator transcription factor [Bacteroidota bacterium]